MEKKEIVFATIKALIVMTVGIAVMAAGFFVAAGRLNIMRAWVFLLYCLLPMLFQLRFFTNSILNSLYTG